MSDEKEVKSPLKGDKEHKSNQITVDIDVIGQMVTAAVTAALKTQGNQLADAILESRKPYVSDAQKENDENMRKQMRQSQDRMLKEIKASQDFCPHKQGSNALSDFSGPLSSIVMHRLDTGELIGICTNCQRIFRSSTPDDRKFFGEKSGNRISSAGQRNFADPNKAIRVGAGLERPS